MNRTRLFFSVFVLWMMYLLPHVCGGTVDEEYLHYDGKRTFAIGHGAPLCAVFDGSQNVAYYGTTTGYILKVNVNNYF
jgi:hypothetical protein